VVGHLDRMKRQLKLLIKKGSIMSDEVLLKKYIQYIKDVEGSDYIEPHDCRAESNVNFTKDEWKRLQEIASRPIPEA